MTVMATMLSPMVTYAQESDQADKKPPLYEEVKELLDKDEVVKAENLELEYGSKFDMTLWKVLCECRKWPECWVFQETWFITSLIARIF